MDTTIALQIRDMYNNNAIQEKTRHLSVQNNASPSAFKKQQLEEVAVGFETMFINMLFSSMRKTLNKEDDILYGGLSQDIFEDMLYEEYAEEMAKTNFLGLGKTIIEQYQAYM